MAIEMIPEQASFNKILVDHQNRRQARDKENVLASLQNGELIAIKDAILRPISSRKHKFLLANVVHLEVQLGRLTKIARDTRREIARLTVEE